MNLELRKHSSRKKREKKEPKMNKKLPCHVDEKIESLFELKRTLEVSFFKNFEESYDFPSGLNFTHMKTIINLHIHGKLSMSDLCLLMVLEKGSFTPVAAKLVEQKLVVKKRCCQDRRIFYLDLSQKGQELAARFFIAHVEYMQSILERLSLEDQDEYFNLIMRLNNLNKKIEFV